MVVVWEVVDSPSETTPAWEEAAGDPAPDEAATVSVGVTVA